MISNNVYNLILIVGLLYVCCNTKNVYIFIKMMVILNDDGVTGRCFHPSDIHAVQHADNYNI